MARDFTVDAEAGGAVRLADNTNSTIPLNQPLHYRHYTRHNPVAD